MCRGWSINKNGRFEPEILTQDLSVGFLATWQLDLRMDAISVQACAEAIDVIPPPPIVSAVRTI